MKNLEAFLSGLNLEEYEVGEILTLARQEVLEQNVQSARQDILQAVYETRNDPTGQDLDDAIEALGGAYDDACVAAGYDGYDDEGERRMRC